MEPVAVKSRIKWLRPDTGKERMAQRIAVSPQHEPEAARIAQAHDGAAREHEIEMVVQRRGRCFIHDPQASRHAEVQEQRAAVAPEQQVLAAAAEACDRGTGSRNAWLRTIAVLMR
jgi:hypothetical protein